MVEIGLLPDAGEHVGDGTPTGPRVERLVRREQRHAGCACQLDEAAEYTLAVSRALPLQLDVTVGPSEDSDETIEARSCRRRITSHEASRERSVRAAGEAHQTVRRGREIVERERGLALRRGELHPRDQPAEIAVALPILHEQRQPRAILERQLAADEWLDAGSERRVVESRRAVQAIAID